MQAHTKKPTRWFLQTLGVSFFSYLNKVGLNSNVMDCSSPVIDSQWLNIHCNCFAIRLKHTQIISRSHSGISPRLLKAEHLPPPLALTPAHPHPHAHIPSCLKVAVWCCQLGLTESFSNLPCTIYPPTSHLRLRITRLSQDLFSALAQQHQKYY